MNTKNVLLGVFVALTLVFASLTLAEYSRVTPTQTLTSTTTATKTVVSTSTSTSTLTTTLITTSSTTTTSTSTATAATDPTNGLELRLYLNTSSSSGTGASVSIFADAYNPSSSTLNVTSANDWVVPISGINGDVCGSDTVRFAMAEGYYTSSNVTAAKLLVLLDPSTTFNCPVYFGYGNPTGFLFQPMSDGGASYGCVGVSPCLTGNATATYNLNPDIFSGYYQGDTFTSFPRGTYTVLAEDEWGALVLAYFRVSLE
jgi:hypothetical protein